MGLLQKIIYDLIISIVISGHNQLMYHSGISSSDTEMQLEG